MRISFIHLLFVSLSSPTIRHVARQLWMVLAGNPGRRTPFDASLVGVCTKHHRCLSVPVSLGPSAFVATIPFSCANHPIHRWTIARIRTRALFGPSRRARARRVVSTRPLTLHLTLSVFFSATVKPLPTSYHYIGPYVDFAPPCLCNSVTYNLMAACSTCQNHTFIR